MISARSQMITLGLQPAAKCDASHSAPTRIPVLMALRCAADPAPPVDDEDVNNVRAHSPPWCPLAIRPTISVSRTGAAQQDTVASAFNAQDTIVCFLCGKVYVPLMGNDSDPECCLDCVVFLWSPREPLAKIPGCPCAQTAGSVMCVCGRRASEHCPDKVHPSPKGAVRKSSALSSCPKWQALRRGYRNLKKTVVYHKRYLQAMRESYGENLRNHVPGLADEDGDDDEVDYGEQCVEVGYERPYADGAIVRRVFYDDDKRQ